MISPGLIEFSSGSSSGAIYFPPDKKNTPLTLFSQVCGISTPEKDPLPPFQLIIVLLGGAGIPETDPPPQTFQFIRVRVE